MTRDLIGKHTVFRPPLDRQLAIDAFAAMRSGHPMTALLELDVTDALAAIERLRGEGRRVSLFAFLVRAIAVAISEHPDLNLVRHGDRLVRFEDVDVSVPVEVQSDAGPFPREVIIRRAQDCTAEGIYVQLEAARVRHAEAGALSDEDRWVRRLATVMRWIPRVARIWAVRRIMGSAFRIKARAGTTIVTSIGKFAAIPGFAFSFDTGPRAAGFVIGSVVDKPWLHEGEIKPRSILALSIQVSHDLVDGAPAARFAERLQSLIESADGLDVPVEGEPPAAPTKPLDQRARLEEEAAAG